MMAFLAMMIAALAAINQYSAQLQSYDETYRTEFELMANALALEEMEIIDMTTDWDDLENWAGVEMTRTYEVANGDLEFTLTASVQFVDDNGEASAAATSNKELTISATNSRFTYTLVSHSRIISE